MSLGCGGVGVIVRLRATVAPDKLVVFPQARALACEGTPPQKHDYCFPLNVVRRFSGDTTLQRSKGSCSKSTYGKLGTTCTTAQARRETPPTVMVVLWSMQGTICVCRWTRGILLSAQDSLRLPRTPPLCSSKIFFVVFVCVCRRSCLLPSPRSLVHLVLRIVWSITDSNLPIRELMFS